MSSLDVMLDLETTGISAGCGILSVGACTFDLQQSFYESVSLQSCLDIGLINHASTMQWWEKQSPEAKEAAFSGVLSITEVCGKFSDWFRSLTGSQRSKFIWGNGADFDLPILGAAFKAVGMELPWAAYNGRCYRTLKNLYKDVAMDKFVGVKHNALQDAKNQAAHAVVILQKHFSK